MATLGWRADQYTLSEASENIGEILGAVANDLPAHGYADVTNHGHVFASKSNCLLHLHYLYIGDRSFWQVVTCSGPDQPTIDGVMEEVKGVVAGLHFL